MQFPNLPSVPPGGAVSSPNIATDMITSAARAEIVQKDLPHLQQLYMSQLRDAVDKGDNSRIITGGIRMVVLDEIGRTIVQRGNTRPTERR